ncbi:MAG TPA: hypothetical protein VKP14_06200 [Gaiellaceae bacterium]|nr:hypothetical protein [Gaiellaceae bacterium]
MERPLPAACARPDAAPRVAVAVWLDSGEVFCLGCAEQHELLRIRPVAPDAQLGLFVRAFEEERKATVNIAWKSDAWFVGECVDCGAHLEGE